LWQCNKKIRVAHTSNTDFEYNFYIGYFKVGFTEYLTWLRRVRAAARQSSSELGSALALHFT
jgi:hypothetical protein